MTTLEWVLVALVIIAFNVGFIAGCWWASRGNEDLERALRCKRDAWCGGCRFKLDAKGFDDLLLAERRSKYARLREKEKIINELRGKLYAATLARGVDFMGQNIARL